MTVRIDAVSNGLAYSRAVEAELLAETGVKPAVGFNWNNGTPDFGHGDLPRALYGQAAAGAVGEGPGRGDQGVQAEPAAAGAGVRGEWGRGRDTRKLRRDVPRYITSMEVWSL